MANQECKFCGKKAVYWNSILKVIMCHACRMTQGVGIRVG